MAEAAPAVPVTIIPSTVKPTATPAPAAIPAPAADATAAELADYRAKVREAEARALTEKKTRITERRQWEAEKKGLGEKLSKLSEYEKREREAKLNPSAYLEGVYGKDWYDRVVEAKVSGGAPTADTVALEIQRVRDEMEAKFSAEKSERAKAEEAAANQRVQEARQSLRYQGDALVKASAAEYPLLSKLPNPGAAIAQHIEEQFNEAHAKRQEGEEVFALSPKEAAEAIETMLYGFAEAAAQHEKYQPKLRERLTPQKVNGSLGATSQQQSAVQQPQSAQQPERRTLSNALTGSTPGRQAPRSDAERRERAIAAYNASRFKAPA